MRTSLKFAVVFVFASVLSIFALHDADAQTLVLQPDGAAGKDSALVSVNPGTNYGTNNDFIQNWSGTDHGVIEFDLSALPPGATITGATLEVSEHSNCSANQNAIEVHLNSAAWDEATVTWSNAPAYGASLGTNSGETAGCDLLIFGVTGAVQDWVSGASPNYGFRLTGPGGADVIKFASSSDDGTAAIRPILRIDYNALAAVNVPTVTEWGMILFSMLIALSAVAILWRRRVTA